MAICETRIGFLKLSVQTGSRNEQRVFLAELKGEHQHRCYFWLMVAGVIAAYCSGVNTASRIFTGLGSKPFL